MGIEINRRGFLKHATLSMLALPVGSHARLLLRGENPPDGELAALRAQLLALVNQERAEDGLTTLKLDRLACDIAQAHATEMAVNNFLSHWGLDGRKPYHRYAFAGGTDATSENDSATDFYSPMSSLEIAEAPIRMHKSMHAEVPPDDGHRKAMLAPQNTHAGFGVAVSGFHERLCEIYVARYVSIGPYPLTRRPQSRFVFTGRVLDPRYSIEGIDVHYEPLPSPPDRRWLQIPRPYSLPENPISLYPKLPANRVYEDGSSGDIEFPSPGSFRAPIELSRKQPGVYTIAVWIQLGENAEPFQATHVCVRAE